MSSAGEVLPAIERRLAIIRRGAETLDEQFRRARAQLMAIEQKQVALLTRLARLRMAGIERGELLERLGDADRRVAEILQIRSAAEESLHVKLTAAENALAAARSVRVEHAPTVAAASQAAETAVEERDALLAASASYAAKLAAARTAQATAERAEAKAAVAESDRLDKTKAYDADPVFAYLRSRGFGTSAYAAGPTARALDTWVARRNGFEALRRNYWLLHEIPRRLAEHARRMREQAESSRAAARALEAEAAATAGVAAAQRALAEAEQRLADLDRTIDAHAAAFAAYSQERAEFAAGEDEHATRCAALLADALQRADTHDLRKRAVRTSTEEDDRLVDEVEGHEREHARQQQELIRLRRLHQAERERALGLEEVRRRLEGESRGGRPARAANGELVETLLDRFVAGTIGTDDLAEGLLRQLVNSAARSARRSPK